MLPSRCENAAEAVFSAPHSCLTTPLPYSLQSYSPASMSYRDAPSMHSVTRHTSHITHHTSHITHHTSHITHHTSHVTLHNSITWHPGGGHHDVGEQGVAQVCMCVCVYVCVC